MKVTPNGSPLIRVSRFRNYVKFVIMGEIGQMQHLTMMDSDDIVCKSRLAELQRLAEELIDEMDHRYKVIKDTSEERND